MDRGHAFGYYNDWASRDGYGDGRKHPNTDDRAVAKRGGHHPLDEYQRNHINMETYSQSAMGGFDPSQSMKKARNNNDTATGRKSWDNQESSSESTQQPRSKAVRVFQRFAEKCSMQGPPYIYASTWWFSRLAWTMLLMAALAFMSYHLFYLCKTYFAWPTKNKLSLGFSSLQFPAVTVCNVNPIRASMLKELSDDMKKFVRQVDPDMIGGILDKLPPRPNTTASSGRRRRRDTSDDDDDQTQLDDLDFGQNKGNFSNAREDVDNDEAYQNLQGFANSWEKEAKQSAFSRLETTFRELYAAEDIGKRARAGHQLKDMLLSCSFAGKSCYPKNFSLITTTEFGNCYTLEYEKFISRDSGPNGGLELLMFLDTEEYIRGITPDDGLQVSIHSPHTVPFPGDEGVAVSAGSHTKLSLKLIQVERLGQPYGDCTESSEYMEKYQVTYSRQLCFRFCQEEEILRSCNCRDETVDDVNRLLNATRYRPCRKKQEMACLLRTRWRYQNGDVVCSCYNPCEESKYEKSISSRPWPNKEYALNILAKTACRRLPGEKCNRLKKKDSQHLSREFVKLNIFYEDLNYENITEEPDYETVQFISDVGGTLGLWIGLSALSLLEVIQLVVELVKLFCCSCCSAGRKSK